MSGITRSLIERRRFTKRQESAFQMKRGILGIYQSLLMREMGLLTKYGGISGLKSAWGLPT